MSTSTTIPASSPPTLLKDNHSKSQSTVSTPINALSHAREHPILPQPSIEILTSMVRKSRGDNLPNKLSRGTVVTNSLCLLDSRKSLSEIKLKLWRISRKQVAKALTESVRNSISQTAKKCNIKVHTIWPNLTTARLSTLELSSTSRLMTPITCLHRKRNSNKS